MSDKIKQSKCACNCFVEKAVDPSRRDFIRKASTLTLIGSTAFILEACGGGSSPTGPDNNCLLYTSPSPRDRTRSRMPSSA